jgi:uncharacterized OB-fold protein
MNNKTQYEDLTDKFNSLKTKELTTVTCRNCNKKFTPENGVCPKECDNCGYKYFTVH